MPDPRPADPEWWGPLPNDVSEDEQLIISYERACLDVAYNRGGTERVADYGNLRRLILERMKTGDTTRA